MPKITLILHNIRSTHNVGSIFRTAEGFGVEQIVLSGYTPYPRVASGETRLPHIADKLDSQIHKTALGAEKLVPFNYVEDLGEWIDNFAGPIIALEQTTTSVNLRDFFAPGRFALIVGEEVHGIADELLDKCDSAIEIPMVGKKESFNVSVACGIALYGLSLQNHVFAA